jgi:hypothetical protein
MLECNLKNERRTGMKGVYDLFKDREESGDVKIIRYTWTESDDPIYNLRAHRDGHGFMAMYPGAYVKMIVGKELMMSDTVMERLTNHDFIHNAKGNVLIAGLGLGMVLRNIIDRPTISKITVVELSPDVIKLVAPKFKNPKLEIIEGNIFEFKTQEKFDSIYFDIWPGISQDNLEDIRALHHKFKSRKNEGAYMESWMADYLRRQRKKDLRDGFGRW